MQSLKGRAGAPGPSRLAYRMARLWALPGVRSLVQVYLPLVALTLAAWGVVSTDRLRLAVQDRASALVERLAARPEFAMKELAIEGATPALAAEVRRAVGPVEGLNSLALDVDGVRAAVEEIGAVARASVQVDPAGLMTVAVERRVPVALWRDGGDLALIDVEGVAIGAVSSRIVYPELPLLVGPGAPAAVGEALALLEAAPSLRPRIRGLARVGERRWDLVLERDIIVMLPEDGAARALVGIMALHFSESLFDRDLAAVDLRVPGRPVLRTAGPEGTGAAIDRAVGLVLGEDT